MGIPKTIDNDISWIDQSFGFQTAFARAADSICAARKRVDQQGHAVVVVAEGAGQELFPQRFETDASGNARLGDIGALLRERITEHFAAHGSPLSLRYLAPGYAI